MVRGIVRNTISDTYGGAEGINAQLVEGKVGSTWGEWGPKAE